MIITQKYFLHFPVCETNTPIVYKLVKDFDLEVNIFRARVTCEGEGYLVLDVKGEAGSITKAMEYIASFGVTISSVKKGVVRDETLCNHCGNCISHCKVGALHIGDMKTRKVVFDDKLCIACGKCVDNCPMKACSTVF